MLIEFPCILHFTHMVPTLDRPTAGYSENVFSSKCREKKVLSSKLWDMGLIRPYGCFTKYITYLSRRSWWYSDYYYIAFSNASGYNVCPHETPTSPLKLFSSFLSHIVKITRLYDWHHGICENQKKVSRIHHSTFPAGNRAVDQSIGLDFQPTSLNSSHHPI